MWGKRVGSADTCCECSCTPRVLPLPLPIPFPFNIIYCSSKKRTEGLLKSVATGAALTRCVRVKSCPVLFYIRIREIWVKVHKFSRTNRVWLLCSNDLTEWTVPQNPNKTRRVSNVSIEYEWGDFCIPSFAPSRKLVLVPNSWALPDSIVLNSIRHSISIQRIQ